MASAPALAAIDEVLAVSGADIGDPSEAGHRPVALHTQRGTVALRHHGAPGAGRGVVWIGGVGGGFDSPGRGLYPSTAKALVSEGVASVQVQLRRPGDLEESVFDCLAGLWYLRERGASRLAAVGHSFGGAVVVQAAVADPTVRTLVTLATQGHGTDVVVRLDAGTSLLAVHGADDQVLPVDCSRRLHARHPGDARLVVYDAAGHVLDEVADELGELVLAWLVEQLVDEPRTVEGTGAPARPTG